jgi:hypothetical protein
MLSTGKDAPGHATCERHRPELTLLYKRVEQHYPALIAVRREAFAPAVAHAVWPKPQPCWPMKSFPMYRCASG